MKYVVLRGQFGRKEKAESGASRFVFYGPGDTVEMNESEVAKFGLARLRRFDGQKTVEQVVADNAARDAKVDEAVKQHESEQSGKPAGDSEAAALIDEAGKLSGSSDFAAWRNRVVESGILGDSVPQRKSEIVAELEKVK